MEAEVEFDEPPGLAVLAAARRTFPSAEAATACQPSAGAAWPCHAWGLVKFTSAASPHSEVHILRAWFPISNHFNFKVLVVC
jgi:hypothetical protein